MTKPRPPLEREILADIRAVFARIPWVTLWRNNTGALKDVTGRTVQFGLCEGSADLVGIVAPHGRWIAIEVKRPGKRPTAAQLRFLERVRSLGGVGVWIDDAESAIAALAAARGCGHEAEADVLAAYAAHQEAKARKRRPVRVA